MKTVAALLTLVAFWQPFARQGADYSPNPVPVAKHRFVVIAHRGDHVSHPENTIAAYDQAIKDGADYVEIDLRTTKDGQLVSLHDGSLDRMTDGKGQLKDMVLGDLEKLSIKTGQPGIFRIPTFKQILALCKNRIYIYIDFKDADAAAAYSLIKQYQMEKQVIVYINSAEQLVQWRKAASKVPLMLSLPDEVKDGTGMLKFIALTKPDLLDGNFKQYNAELLSQAKRLNLPVWPDGQSHSEGPVVWEEAISKGLTGLQTDHPQDFIAYLKQKEIR